MCLHVSNRLARGAAGRVYASTAPTTFAMSVRSTQVFILKHAQSQWAKEARVEVFFIRFPEKPTVLLMVI